jgi:outer membrane protein TolC
LGRKQNSGFGSISCASYAGYENDLVYLVCFRLTALWNGTWSGGVRGKNVMEDSTRFWLAALLVAVLCTSAAARPSDHPGQQSPPKDQLPRPKAVPSETNAPHDPATILDPASALLDLATALRLAGVANPEILLARERVVEAAAVHQLAAVQLLPSINLGANYDAHIGVLQQSTGNILKVNRDALYVGLGANAVGAGTVNVPGIVWSGNVSEVLFTALASRQLVREREFASQAVRNEVLLRVAVGYVELLRAEGRRSIALKTRDEAALVARDTANWAKTGQGRKADADRAATELEQRNSDILQAENDILAASARLAQLLNLDPSVRLHPIDGWVVPSPVVPDLIPLPELIAIALTRRPELQEQQAAIREALLVLRGARLLPFSPTILLGYSDGTFGGGSNLVSEGIRQADGTILQQPRFGSFRGREDFDAVLFWSARNLGLGNLAQIRLSQSHLRSANLRQIEVLDRVRTEVAEAYARTHARFAQIANAERAVQTGQNAFKEDYERTHQAVGLPIEVLDSLRLLGRSRNAYLDAIADYNRAQFELYVALGQPPADVLARPIPSDLVPPPTESAAPPQRP